jgi:arabinofuranosyltransferase
MSGSCSAPPAARQDVQGRHTLTIALLVATVLGTRLLGLYVRHLYDDAFITFRYAENLAAGNGFVYNLGERVLGTTSPLWGLVLTPFAWAPVPLTTIVPLVNALLDCAVVLLVLLHYRQRKWMLPGVLFAVMFAGDPNMVRIPVGGMETSLLLVLCVAALMLFEGGHRVVAAVLAALCYFLRPESLLLLALLLVLVARKRKWRELTVAASLSLLTVGLPVALIWAHYGIPIAQSVVAKSGEVNGNLLPVLKGAFAENPIHLLVLPFAVWGATRAIRLRGLPRLALLWGVVYVGAYVLVRPAIWGWYFVPVHFVKFSMAAFGLADIFGRIGSLHRVSAGRWGLVGSLLALLSGTAIAIVAGPAPVRRNVYEPLQAWFRQHPTRGGRIMASDIGAVGYYSDTYICDLAGLVMPQSHGHWDFATSIDRWQPEYLFLIATSTQVGRFLASRSASRYRPVARFSKNGRQDLYPDPKTLPTGWLQDYILYERTNGTD